MRSESPSKNCKVDMEPSSPWPVYVGAPLNFSYTVLWFHTDKEFKAGGPTGRPRRLTHFVLLSKFQDRTNRYLDPKFFEHKASLFFLADVCPNLERYTWSHAACFLDKAVYCMVYCSRQEDSYSCPRYIGFQSSTLSCCAFFYAPLLPSS